MRSLSITVLAALFLSIPALAGVPSTPNATAYPDAYPAGAYPPIAYSAAGWPAPAYPGYGPPAQYAYPAPPGRYIPHLDLWDIAAQASTGRDLLSIFQDPELAAAMRRAPEVLSFLRYRFTDPNVSAATGLSEDYLGWLFETIAIYGDRLDPGAFPYDITRIILASPGYNWRASPVVSMEDRGEPNPYRVPAYRWEWDWAAPATVMPRGTYYRPPSSTAWTGGWTEWGWVTGPYDAFRMEGER